MHARLLTLFLRHQTRIHHMPHSLSYTTKQKVLRSILWLTIVSASLLFILNFQLGNLDVGRFLEAFLVIFSTVALTQLPKFKSERQVNLIGVLFLILLMFTFSYAFWDDSTSKTVFAWVFLAPLLIYQLTNLKLGTISTAVFFVIAASLYAVRYYSELQMVSMGSLLNIVICIATIWMLTYIYEDSHRDSRAKLTDLATKDPLTGLLNRSTLASIFHKYREHTIGVIILDLDGFKGINDQHGHHIGDEVLIHVASILRDTIQPPHRLFRLGGEEFGVVMLKSTSSDVASLAQTILDNLNTQAFVHDDIRIPVTASVGVAMYPHEASTLSETMTLADKRMYYAKTHGKNQVTAK